jgi:hypothetical protein
MPKDSKGREPGTRGYIKPVKKKTKKKSKWPRWMQYMGGHLKKEK